MEFLKAREEKYLSWSQGSSFTSWQTSPSLWSRVANRESLHTGTYLFSQHISYPFEQNYIYDIWAQGLVQREKSTQPSSFSSFIATTPPTCLQPSTVHSHNTARKLFNTSQGTGAFSATHMHNLLIYTLPVNSGLSFSCINEFQGSKKSGSR